MYNINHKERGFTLVEVMIVVAIIGLLAAIAIPNLLRARNNSNEGAMKSGMRTFSSANESYRAAQAAPMYASAISNLTGTTPPYLDTTWTAGTKNGFTLTYGSSTSLNGDVNGIYALNAAPGAGMTNHYCVDESGVVYAASSAFAQYAACDAHVSAAPISG